MFPKQYTQAVMTGESKWQTNVYLGPFQLIENISHRFGWFCGGPNANPDQTSNCQRTRINVLLFVDVGLLYCCQLCIPFHHNSITVRAISHETVCENYIASWWGSSSGKYEIKIIPNFTKINDFHFIVRRRNISHQIWSTVVGLVRITTIIG